MSKYTHHSLALNDDEEAEFKKTGLGVKKIFMAMVRSLNTIRPPEEPQEESQPEHTQATAITAEEE